MASTHPGQSLSQDRQTFSPLFKLLSANSAMKMADELANAKTVLPWLLSLAGAPVFFTGLLVPIREALSMLPQLLVAPLIRRKALRKQVWLAAAISQGVCLALMPLALLANNGLLAGWIVMALLVLYSLSRCFTSITAKDILAKTVSESERGKIQGWAKVISAPFIIAIGLLLYFPAVRELPGFGPVLLLMTAAGLWLLSAGFMAVLPETPGETEAGSDFLKTAVTDVLTLLKEGAFIRLLLVRSLLLFPVLAAPFLVSHIVSLQTGAHILGLLIALNGLGSMSSALAWGKLADHSSKLAMVVGGLVSCLALLAPALMQLLAPDSAVSSSVYFYVAVFAILIVGHTGIRIGRKTYTVNMAEGNQRTRIVATGNTLIGIILLLTSAMSLLAQFLPLFPLLLCFALPGLAGCLVALTLVNKPFTNGSK